MGFGFDIKMDDVKFNRNFNQMLNSPGGDVHKYLRKRGLLIVNAAKRQVGVDTGNLKRSIHMVHQRVGVHQQLWIGSREQHALMHHNGTRPHQIVPKNQQMMRFSSRGRIVYSRSVQHPGTKPNRYLSDNLKLAIV